MVWRFLSIFILLGFILAPKASSGSYEICDAYRWKNAELGCDANNYLMRFGYQYCRLYLQLNDQFSQAGQSVLENIRACLINHLEQHADLTCGNAKHQSEADHFTCYTKSGFCQLSAWDKWLVAKVAWKEFLDPEFRQVANEVHEFCRR